MKKGLLYTPVFLLYVLTALFGFAALNTIVSLKYEVGESYIVVEMNYQVSAEAKQKRVEELGKEGKRLKSQTNGLSLAAVGAFIGATLILIRKNGILKKKIISGSETETLHAENGKAMSGTSKFQKKIAFTVKYADHFPDHIWSFDWPYYRA